MVVSTVVYTLKAPLIYIHYLYSKSTNLPQLMCGKKTPKKVDKLVSSAIFHVRLLFLMCISLNVNSIR